MTAAEGLMMAACLHLEMTMHCPECNSLVEADAGACHSCGLLLVESTLPSTLPDALHRRSEDLAHIKRRAADRELAVCRYCGGEVVAKAVRCRHCSEIVNDDYYRERARRLRSRVNYASWVTYVFGLAAWLVLPSVGLISIAAGLLLSITYYAIPAEPPPRKGEKRRGLMATIKRQIKLERVAVAVPRTRKKLIFIGTPLIAALVGYAVNLLLLQQPMNDVMKTSMAFQGMKVSAHYQYWVVPGIVVYDLESVGVRQTPIDVHTAFLEFAKKLKEKRYSRVELSFRGTTKFSMDGTSFARLGEEYAKKNYTFALYRLPHLLHAEDGARAPSPTASDRDALLQLHRAWYGDDALTHPVADLRH
jgi:ribosomal protein L40E